MRTDTSRDGGVIVNFAEAMAGSEEKRKVQ